MELRKLVPVFGLLIALLAIGSVASLAWADASLAAPDGAAAAAEEQQPTENGVESNFANLERRDLSTVEWQTDDQGKRYYIQEIERGIEGRDWIWLDEKRIQVKYGIQYDIVDHDEYTFAIKMYERTNVPAVPTQEERLRERKEREAAIEKRRQEIAKTYEANLEEVDRVQLAGFDRGLPRQGQWRNGFDVADMNGDGHQDIVFGASRKAYPARPYIFLGNSAGQWRLWGEARYPPLPYDYGDAAVADFNQDGNQDLALGIHLKGILVLVGDGKGQFKPWSRGIGFEIPGQGGDASTFSSRALEVTDWNGDGKPDVLALGEGPKGIARVVAGDGALRRANGPIFFINRGDGSWRPRGEPSKIFGDTLALGDFNGDGRGDFVTSSNAVNHRILNLATGDELWETVDVKAVRSRSYLRAVTSGSLNGDAVSDLVVGYVGREIDVWRTGVDVLLGDKELDWKRVTLWATEGKDGIYGLATGDLNGDSHQDVAAATGNGEVLVFLGDGAGSFVREKSPELPKPLLGCRGYGLRFSDLDGDGRDELIVGFAGERSELGFGSKPGCAQSGSLRVWKAAANG